MSSFHICTKKLSPQHLGQWVDYDWTATYVSVSLRPLYNAYSSKKSCTDIKVQLCLWFSKATKYIAPLGSASWLGYGPSGYICEGSYLVTCRHICGFDNSGFFKIKQQEKVNIDVPKDVWRKMPVFCRWSIRDFEVLAHAHRESVCRLFQPNKCMCNTLWDQRCSFQYK